MPDTGATASTPILRKLLNHPYTAVSVVFFVALGIVSVGRHSSEWDAVYVAAARLLWQGRDIYRDCPAFTYPPFSALLMMPFLALPAHLGRAIWYAISVVSLIYVVKTAWRLAGGRPVEPLTPIPGREQLAFIIGQLCALQFALNALTHLQTDLLIAALLMAGCAAIAAGRYFRAASWIGLAAAFKATPLLFAPYLLWRKQWLAAAWLIGVTVMVNLLPNAIHGPPDGGPWLAEWCNQYLKPMAASGYMPGAWRNDLNNNQSLAGAANRWLATTWTIDADGFRAVDRPGRAGTPLIRLLFLAACGVMVLPAAWAMWRRRAADDPPWRMIECGMILLLMVLLSPNSSRGHFCVLYLPAFCLARLAVRPSGAVLLRGFLAAAVICSTLSIHLRYKFTMAPEQVLLWAGVVMFAAVFLLLASAGIKPVALLERE
jgi:hypothetical protein